MVDKSIAEDTTATVPLGEAALVDDNLVHNSSLPIGDSQVAAMLVDDEVGEEQAQEVCIDGMMK